MLLPNAHRAVVPLQKLAGYSLDPDHESGGHKARVFRAVLGLAAADADWLRARILDAVLRTEAVVSEPSPFGARYVVDFPLTTDVGTAVVRTGWMVRDGETVPRLTTCFIR